MIKNCVEISNDLVNLGGVQMACKILTAQVKPKGKARQNPREAVDLGVRVGTLVNAG